MSLRLEMLQVARLAPKMLGDSTSLVRDFFLGQIDGNGAGCDRDGTPDLYYTVFALAGLQALQAELPPGKPVARFLESFSGGAELDFVHLGALARCWAAVEQAIPETFADAILERLECYRTADGGYDSAKMGGRFGSAYGCFIALGAYQDLKRELPEPLRMVQCLKFLETPDGAWANARGLETGSTNATAAAVILLRHLGFAINENVAGWLLAKAHKQGGFLAMPAAPLPDLLSTATTLHALSGMQTVVPAPMRERCLDFVDSLWTNKGGFHGHWADDHLDAEYTFYGLLALGHLALE